MRRVLFALSVALMFGFTACENRGYCQFRHTPVRGWEKTDTLSFAVPRITTAGLYSIDVALRTNSAYPFQSLILIVKQRVLPARRVETNTVNCVLTDRYGRPLGQGISYYQHRFHVNDLHLSPGDSLSITIRHDMRREALTGIGDVGVMVEKK